MKEQDWTGFAMLVVRGGKVYMVQESDFMAGKVGESVTICGRLLEIGDLYGNTEQKAPVAKGKSGTWCPIERIRAYCSECGREGYTDMNYCPNCGAEMGGKE